jgi:hypothetical protein
MVTLKEELLAANIRKQIAYLECVMTELAGEPERSKEILQRMREVENQLRKLRSQFGN